MFEHFFVILCLLVAAALGYAIASHRAMLDSIAKEEASQAQADWKIVTTEATAGLKEVESAVSSEVAQVKTTITTTVEQDAGKLGNVVSIEAGQVAADVAAKISADTKL